MRLSLKQVVRVLAVASFASMALGLTLQLHLAGAGDADHHDSAHCSSCRLMLTGAAKFHLEDTIRIAPDSNRVEATTENASVLPRRYALLVSAPRPPPITTI